MKKARTEVSLSFLVRQSIDIITKISDNGLCILSLEIVICFCYDKNTKGGGA